MKLSVIKDVLHSLSDGKDFALKEMDRSPQDNLDTGWRIAFGNTHLSKLFSRSSVGKSISPEHWQVISGLRDMVKNAVLVESHADRKAIGDPGKDHIAAVHRLVAPVYVNGRILRAKLTVYEMKDEEQGMKFKNYELAEVELPVRDGEVANQASPESPLTPESLPDAVSIADLLRGATRDSDGQLFREDENDQH